MVSENTEKEIARRIAAARPVMLTDMRAVLRARGGRASVEQLDVLARVLAADHLHRRQAVTALAGAVVGWLAECCVSADTSAPWWADRWPALLAAAEAAGQDGAEPLPSPTIEQCRTRLDITGEEVVELRLRKLIPEALEKRRARAAEGAQTGKPGRPKGEQPWVALGIPKPTYFRRLARQKAEKEQALAAGIATVSQNETKSVSTAQTGTEAPPPSVPPISTLFSRDEFRLTPGPLPEDRVMWDEQAVLHRIHDTAESRRLAHLARQSGLSRAAPADIDPDDPETWYVVAEGALTGELAETWAEALEAAARGQNRRSGMDWASQEAYAEFYRYWWQQVIVEGKRPRNVPKAAWATVPEAVRADPGFAEQAYRYGFDMRVDTAEKTKRVHDALAEYTARRQRREAYDRGEIPPTGIPDTVWNSVPEDWREEVLRLMGLYHIWGLTPVDGLKRAIGQILREEAYLDAKEEHAEAVFAAVLAADPSADPDLTAQSVWHHATRYDRPTVEEATRLVLADLASPDWQPWRGRDDLVARIAALIPAMKPPVPEALRDIAAQGAADLWIAARNDQGRGGGRFRFADYEAAVVAAQEQVDWCRRRKEPICIMGRTYTLGPTHPTASADAKAAARAAVAAPVAALPVDDKERRQIAAVAVQFLLEDPELTPIDAVEDAVVYRRAMQSRRR